MSEPSKEALAFVDDYSIGDRYEAARALDAFAAAERTRILARLRDEDVVEAEACERFCEIHGPRGLSTWNELPFESDEDTDGKDDWIELAEKSLARVRALLEKP